MECRRKNYIDKKQKKMTMTTRNLLCKENELSILLENAEVFST